MVQARGNNTGLFVAGGLALAGVATLLLLRRKPSWLSNPQVFITDGGQPGPGQWSILTDITITNRRDTSIQYDLTVLVQNTLGGSLADPVNIVNTLGVNQSIRVSADFPPPIVLDNGQPVVTIFHLELQPGSELVETLRVNSVTPA